jgi:hypothetical protein
MINFVGEMVFFFEKTSHIFLMAPLDSKFYTNVMIYQWLVTLEFRKP